MHYRIVESLGRGGMGQVFLAEDLKLGRQVAIKVLPSQLADLGDRLDREARVLAALNHPNIVTVHAVEEAEGIRFLVMERIDGQGLDRCLLPAGLPAERFFALALPLVDAVAAAHDRGVLHRDLKPANVMVTTAGRVKVLDFGLAEHLSEQDPQGLEETAVALPDVVGTVPYLAPELLRGEAADERSDLFALGVLLTAMATGRRPFTGKTATEVMLAILREEPLIAPLEPSLPAELREILGRSLARERADRYDSVRWLHQELKALFTATWTTTPALPRRPLSPSKRFLLPLTALLVCGFAVAGWLLTREPNAPSDDAAPRRTIVVLPFENLGIPEDEYFSLGITEEITSRLASARNLGVISRTSALRYADSEKSIQEVGRELGVDFVLKGTVRWDRSGGRSRVRVTPQLVQVESDTHLWANAFDSDFKDIFGVQTQIAQGVFDQLEITLFPEERDRIKRQPTQDLEAYQAYLRGLASSESFLLLETIDTSAGHFQRAVVLDPNFAEAWAELAMVQASAVHWGLDGSPARRAAGKAAIERALALAPDSPVVRRCNGYFLYWTERDYAAAEIEFLKAAQVSPNDDVVLEGMAYLRRRQGRVSEALGLLERSLVLDPQDGTMIRELATTQMLLGRFDLAVKNYDRAIKLLSDPQLAYLSKVRALWKLGRLDEARATLATMPPGDQAQILWFRFWQAVFEDRPDAALAVIADDSTPLRWTQWHMPWSLMRAQVHVARGDRRQAAPELEAARVWLEAARKTQPEDGRLATALGLAMADLGEPERAVELGLESLELLKNDVIALTNARLELAWIYLKVAAFDRALTELETAMSGEIDLTLIRLDLDPRFKPLETDIRFRALVERQSHRPEKLP